MPQFAVEYTYTENSTEVRDEHRPRHREWLRGLYDEGTLLLSGPFADGTGGLLIFSAADADRLADLLQVDPFNEVGVVANVRIKAWSPIIGPITAE
jgi:uncharacterized protein YciI